MENSIVESKTKGRINYIDFLKFIGLTGIIIAHVGQPSWLKMIRSFDVPLMVILSSILANMSFAKYQQSNTPIYKYYLSRVKRLVIPTWIFLVFYFLFSFIVSHQRETITYYIASFGLTRYGMSYVWIILIYLYSAMLIPLFAELKLSFKGIIIVCVAYIIYEIAYYYQIGLNGKLVKAFFETTFYYIIPYGVLTYLGYNYYAMKDKAKYIITIASFVIFALLVVYYWQTTGMFQPVYIVKFPPRLYYMSYGIGCSFALLLICEKNSNLKIFDNKLIRYISTHSMWIYLWHTLVLAAYGRFKLPKVWFIKLFIVYSVSIVIVVVVNKLLDLVEKKYNPSFIKYLRG